MATTRKSKVIGASFPRNLAMRIDSYCSERGCNRSWFLAKAAELYLDQCMEDKEDYEVAVSAWNEFEKGGFKSSPAASVFEKAGMSN